MTPRIYFKRIENSDLNTVHLYEHLIVTKLLNTIQKAGFIPGLWGHIDATSFSDLLMLTIGTYDDSVWEVIEQTLHSPVELNQTSIDNALQQCASEDLATLSYDTDELLPALCAIDKITFQNLDLLPSEELVPTSPVSSSSPIKILNSDPLRFNNCQIDFIYHPSTPTEYAAFLRLVPVISDAATLYFANQGVRIRDTFGPEIREDCQLYCCLEFFVPQEQSVDDLIRGLQDYFATFDFTKSPQAINSYIHCFQDNSPVAAFFPIDYYRDCNVLISRPLIAKAFTPENAQKIWQKLQILYLHES